MQLKNKRIWLVFIFNILLQSFTLAQKNTPISKKNLAFENKIIIPNVKLLGTDNRLVSFNDFPDAKGFIIIFTCNHCPFANLYTQRLNGLNAKYSALNVPLIAINSMDSLIYDEESLAKMKSKSETSGYNFPYLQDADQQVGKSFGAENTPTAFVIWRDKNGLVIKYKGTIDDNGEKPELANPFVSNAVDELLAGREVSIPKTETFGCRIMYRK